MIFANVHILFDVIIIKKKKVYQYLFHNAGSVESERMVS